MASWALRALLTRAKNFMADPEDFLGPLRTRLRLGWPTLAWTTRACELRDLQAAMRGAPVEPEPEPAPEMEPEPEPIAAQLALERQRSDAAKDAAAGEAAAAEAAAAEVPAAGLPSSSTLIGVSSESSLGIVGLGELVGSAAGPCGASGSGTKGRRSKVEGRSSPWQFLGWARPRLSWSENNSTDVADRLQKEYYMYLEKCRATKSISEQPQSYTKGSRWCKSPR